MGPNGTSTCKECKQLTLVIYRGYCDTCLDKAIAARYIEEGS